MEVRYNQKNPADAVLETNLLGFVVISLVAAFFFAVAASVSGYFHLTR